MYFAPNKALQPTPVGVSIIYHAPCGAAELGRYASNYMIDLTGKLVEQCGWAGPVLWVCTADGYSIHFYDAPITLNEMEIVHGDDVGKSLNGSHVTAVNSEAERFSVSFGSKFVLAVEASDIETARIFKKGDLDSHVVYEAGVLADDRD